jgi:hypothetical protein
MEFIWSSYGIKMEFRYIYDHSTTLSIWMKYPFDAGVNGLNAVCAAPDI